MPAFNFPADPSVGQEFNPDGGPIYAWNGYAWDVKTAETVAFDQLVARVEVVEVDLTTKATLNEPATFASIRANGEVVASGDVKAFS
ncbi:hypothetical protein UFOVP139_46 [uncultured Caudovirales phage]|uniref:Uncharacterized protein n=1 Tax=uncultured Caudovirales phage TaxID=2100421 RepID=A0A6J5LDE1_9CAUD|nr:hypothetical protein UFOVP139_46 [uncultured Caudovirales phage]